MPVTVLLADDSEIVRQAIRRHLADSPNIIELVGEAADFPKTIQMVKELKPQVVVLDLHMALRTLPRDVNVWLNGSKLLAISIANDDEAHELAQSYGAVRLLDKLNLYHELVPAIVQVAFSANFAATT